MKRGAYIAAILMLGLGGCAVTSMEAKIRPDVAVAESNIGHGAPVGVYVSDERPNQSVGRRAVGGAKIKMNEDLAAIYQTALVEGLIRQGFAAAPAARDDAQLRVEIRALAYDVSVGWWTGGIETDSAMKVVADGAAETYERLYRSSDEDRMAVVPGAKGSNAKLNAVVTDMLRQALEDRKLLEVLAAETPVTPSE